MPAALADMLAEHLTRLGTTAADPDELVFPAPEGGPLRCANWRPRIWQPACIAARVGKLIEDPETKKESFEGAGFHDLRGANATGLVLARVDLKTAQTRLGHSDPRLTLAVYARSSSDADKDAAETLRAHFSTPTRDARGIAGAAP
jgi:integrase